MKKKTLFTLMIIVLLALVACNPAGEKVSPPAAEGSISGWLWHDACDSGKDGEAPPSSTPDGCVKDTSPLGDYHADGVMSAQEEPIAGVLVQLGKGECPSTGLAEATTIATDLSFSFERLQPGTYCVSIDPSNENNLPLLRPGIWTSPELAQGTIGTSVVVRKGGNVFDINFGWDYQFKP